MGYEVKLTLCALCAFILSLGLGAPILKLMQRLKVRQTTLSYVDNHKEKSGTPTMGGIIFILPAVVISLIFGGVKQKLGIVAAAVMLGFGVIGFLDDFLKMKRRANGGLSPLQKIVGQTGVAAIVTWFAYSYGAVGSAINLPFSGAVWQLGWWFIPFCFIIFIATTNAVNLTDGLDGLAGGTSAVYFAVFTLILSAALSRQTDMGESVSAAETLGLAIFSASLFGGLLGFLWLNANPAKIFMGDTGALALGGAAASVAIFSKNPLIILIVGIMFVISCISVIVQVLYFKATKKRIFLMAPFHHHLQYKGVKEQKIVAFYVITTVAAGLIALASIF